MGLNERHSVAASFEHLIGETIEEDVTRTSPRGGQQTALARAREKCRHDPALHNMPFSPRREDPLMPALTPNT